MKNPVLFSALAADGSARIIEAVGRDAWALTELIQAGDGGCTPIDQPGPRWSAYVFKLRRLGLDIQTITESHGGPFKGTHARYILRTTVHRLTPADSVTCDRRMADAA